MKGRCALISFAKIFEKPSPSPRNTHIRREDLLLNHAFLHITQVLLRFRL